MKNGNITTEMKTKKELATDLQINAKTMRNACRYVEYCKVIENNIGKEKAEIFEEIVHHLELNKKEKISAEQIYQLSKVSAQEQNRIIDIIIKHPQNSKRIINNAIPYCKVRTTVTLPSFVSDWLEGEASEFLRLESDIRKNSRSNKLSLMIGILGIVVSVFLAIIKF